jgi:hypothetical protein
MVLRLVESGIRINTQSISKLSIFGSQKKKRDNFQKKKKERRINVSIQVKILN